MKIACIPCFPQGPAGSKDRLRQMPGPWDMASTGCFLQHACFGFAQASRVCSRHVRKCCHDPATIAPDISRTYTAPRVSEECKIAQLSNQAHMQKKYIQKEAEFSLTLHFEKQEAISCCVGQFILKSAIKKEQASEGSRHRVPISCGKCCRDVTLLRSYLRIL